ncbi:hypothetical protein Ancab_003833 [Ancistrocladus abbreviatus]
MSFDFFGKPGLHDAIRQDRPSVDEEVVWGMALSFVVRLLAYFALLGVVIIVFWLIFKYFGIYDGERIMEERRESERRQLLQPHKTIPCTYGTWEKDVEMGNTSGCSSNSNSCSYQDLYDGKICIICYDEERSCFFVPCGHCATCNGCAQRIFQEENRTCPVCRRFIGKIRKLCKF